MNEDFNRPEPVSGSFNAVGFVRLSAILAPHGPLPISRSSWWAGVKAGRFPQPLKIGPRTTAWRAADILELVEKLSARG